MTQAQVFLDNPAGRLESLLRDLRDTRNPQGESVWQAWARVLGRSTDDQAALLEAFADVLRLPEDIKSGIAALEVDQGLYLGWEPKVKAALSASLANGSGPVGSGVVSQYDETTLNQLAFCSHELHRYAPERNPGEEALMEIHSDLSSLLEDVSTDPDLDATLRGYLTEHIQECVRAIDLYRIRGIKGIEDAWDRAVGELVRRPLDVAVPLLEKPAGKRFERILGRIALLSTILALPLQLTATVHDLGAASTRPPVVEIVQLYDKDPLSGQAALPAAPTSDPGDQPSPSTSGGSVTGG